MSNRTSRTAPTAPAIDTLALLRLARQTAWQVASSREPRDALDAITTGLVAIGFSAASVYRYCTDRECPHCREFGPPKGVASAEKLLHLQASTGLDAPLQQQHRIPLFGTVTAIAIESRAPVLVNTPETGFGGVDPVRVRERRASGWTTIISYPLLVDGEAIGALGMGARVAVTEEAFREVEVFAAHAAAALRLASLHVSAERSRAHEHERANARSAVPIIGHSQAMAEVRNLVTAVARTRTTALILGETGTGKELIARAIHAQSERSALPFVAVNCAAVPSSLIESELFGHERGAFTGAVQQRLGAFEQADKGTLFLDEIAELPLESQTKLLRVLQEREFTRVGGAGAVRVDVRLIAATNRDLQQLVNEGRFRADLYFRLNVFPILIPPLRDRPEDIPPLVEHALKGLRQRLHKRFTSVSADGMHRLAAHSWPGNVRELQNVLERACLVADSPLLQIAPAFLSGLRGVPQNGSAPRTMRDVQRAHIQSVLEHTGGRISGATGAAAVLGMNPNTLRSLMERLGLR